MTPPEVDARGNLNPHYQEGIKVPVRDKDVNGTTIDISGATWKFRSPSIGEVALVADPGNPTGLLLTLTKVQVQMVPAEGELFVIVDTGADPDDVRWEGKITPRGWK